MEVEMSPEDQEYMKLIEKWAIEYDRNYTRLSTEEIKTIYDEAYFEAMRLQRELD